MFVNTAPILLHRTIFMSCRELTIEIVEEVSFSGSKYGFNVQDGDASLGGEEPVCESQQAAIAKALEVIRKCCCEPV